jgi:hypothetical protein
VIHDSVALYVLRIWRRVRRALRNCGRFSPDHYVGRRCASHEFDKQHVKCVVHRSPNDDRIADSVRAAFVLNQGRLPFGRARKQFCPSRHLWSIGSKSLALRPDVDIRLNVTVVGESRQQLEHDTS